LGLLANAIALLSSTKTVVGLSCTNPKSQSNCQSQIALVVALVSAIYSDLVLESTTDCCLVLDHETTPLANRKQFLEVEQ